MQSDYEARIRRLEQLAQQLLLQIQALKQQAQQQAQTGTTIMSQPNQ